MADEEKSSQQVISDGGGGKGDDAPTTKRGHWGSHLQFLLSGLALAVGVGNVWRFPYIVYSNGGGSFFIPYITTLLFVGLPILFQEMAIGQYAKVGCSKIYMNMAPIMKGVAIAALYKVFIGVIYYMVIASWSVFYLAAGFTTQLPWYTCLETWNTRDCYSEDYNDGCQEDTAVFWNFTCSTKEEYCSNHGYEGGWRQETDSCVAGEASTPFSTVLGQYSVSSAEDYFNGRMLGLTKDQDGSQHTWEDFGSPQWELVLCQLFCYILTTLTIIKSAKSLGKAAYVFTVLPYVILTILLIYGLTLPGASDGIDYYLDTDWSYLSDSRVWTEACVQIIMSLGVGVGIHMVLASYNDNDSRILLDATFISGLNSATSIYAGFVVFAMTGFLAYSTHSPVESVVRSGIILAFVSYPAAMLEMTVSPLWSFLFFLMLLNLSLGTIAGALEMLVAFVLEEFPVLQKHRLYVLLAMASGCFLVGLPMSCEGGIHLFTLLDSRGTVSTLLITLGQCIAISWVYGIRNFLEDIKELNVWLMNGYFWGFLWTIVSPGAIIYVYIYSLVDLEPIGYGAYEYPDYIQSVGLFLMLLPIILFSGYAIYFCAKAARAGLSWREFYSHAVKPTDNWWRLRRQKFVVQNEHHGIDSDFKTVHHAHAL